MDSGENIQLPIQGRRKDAIGPYHEDIGLTNQGIATVKLSILASDII